STEIRLRDPDVSFNGEPAIFGRARTHTGSSNFVPPLRSPQKYVQERARNDGQKKAGIQRKTRRNSGNDLPEARYMRRTADGTCFKNRITRFLEIRLRQSAGHTYGNEVHHDRVDDFM